MPKRAWPLALMALWLVGWLGHAATLRGAASDSPPRGMETVQGPVSWAGASGRGATLDDPGDKALWAHPYWTGSPAQPGARLAHTPTWGEAAWSSLATAPIVHGAALIATMLAILLAGGVAEATALAVTLALPRALHPAWFFDSDPRRYHLSALNIVEQQMPHPLWPPGWPTALALSYATLGHEVVIGRVLGVVLFAGFVAVIARLAPPQARVPTALLAAVSLDLVHFAPSLFSEPLFLLLATGALLMPAWAGGVAIALAALTRAHVLVVGPIAWWLTRRPSRGRSARFALGLAAPLMLWGGVQLAGGRSPVQISDGFGMNLYIGHGPGADGRWRDPWPEPAAGFRSAAVSEIAQHPAASATRWARNTVALWGFSNSDRTLATRPLPLPLVPFSLVTVLALIGAARWRRAGGRGGWGLLAWAALTTGLTAIFFVTTRYRLALYPALLPAAGVSISWALQMARRLSRKPISSPQAD